MNKLLLVLLSTATVFASNINAEIKEQAELVFKIPLQKKTNNKTSNTRLYPSREKVLYR